MADVEEFFETIVLPHPGNHEMMTAFLVLPPSELNLHLCAVTGEVAETGENLFLIDAATGARPDIGVIGAQNGAVPMIKIVPDQGDPSVLPETVQDLDGESAVLLLEDASGEKTVRGGRVGPVGEKFGVVVLGAAPPTAVLDVPEDPEARAGERLVGARDHALDHCGRYNGMAVAVQGEVDIAIFLLSEDERRAHDHLQVD